MILKLTLTDLQLKNGEYTCHLGDRLIISKHKNVETICIGTVFDVVKLLHIEELEKFEIILKL